MVVVLLIVLVFKALGHAQERLCMGLTGVGLGFKTLRVGDSREWDLGRWDTLGEHLVF